jgi:HSP20 family molecular chaperone IbpA
MLIKSLDVNMNPSELATADITFYLNEKTDKELIASIMDGRMRANNYRLMPISNPCKEIPFEAHIVPNKPLKLERFIQEYQKTIEGNWDMSDNKPNMTPHSERQLETGFSGPRNSVQVNGRGLSGLAVVEDENVNLRINIPGVEHDRVSIRRIDNVLRIRVTPEVEEFDIASQSFNGKELNYILGDYEHVEHVSLDLGVLEIDIARERDIEDFSIE